jgi:hypothetical protein
MKMDAFSEASRFNERIHRLVSAVLISVMMACAGLTVSKVGSQIWPDWQGSYLVVIGFLIALERFYTYRALKKLSTLGREWVVLISTQWVVNLIVIKLFVSLSQGFGALLAEIPLWQRAFLEQFMSSEYLIAVGFAAIVWFLVGVLGEQLDEMGLDTALIAREVLSAVARDQAPPRQRLMITVFAIGGVLVFLTAIGRVDLRSFFASGFDVVRVPLPSLAAGGAGTLLYFLFGLALLSQSNYITLNTRWFLQHLPVSRKIASRWSIYGLGFLIFVALIAAILPTSYSLGLLSVLGYLIDIIFGILMLIVGLITALLGFLVTLPFLLFGRDVPANLPQSTPPPILAAPPPTLTEPGSPFPWLDLLKSLLFWAIFVGVVGYSVAQYLRQHEEILTALRKFPGWKILSAFWHWIGSLWGHLNHGVARVIESGKARLRPQGDNAGLGILSRFRGIRHLTPRQKVYFYYHALLRRGNETGLPRSQAQTPDEYALTLEHSLPTVEEEIESLTDAFNEARYSRHPVEDQDVSTVKSYWEHIRQVFRGHRG